LCVYTPKSTSGLIPSGLKRSVMVSIAKSFNYIPSALCAWQSLSSSTNAFNWHHNLFRQNSKRGVTQSCRRSQMIFKADWEWLSSFEGLWHYTAEMHLVLTLGYRNFVICREKSTVGGRWFCFSLERW
jgi:hypothetical protein